MVEYVENQYRGSDKDHKYAVQMDLATHADSQLRLINILFEDARIAMEECSKEPDNQFKRRTLVRTLFSHIECQLSIMRQAALTWHRLGAIKLTEKDLQRLGDEIKITGDDVLMPGKPRRLKLIDNFKFTLKVYGQTPGKSSINIDIKSEGWNSFPLSIKIRDNLMHPKTEENLLLTDIDIKNVMTTWGWFIETITQASKNNHLS
jgi:hypothetical protein